MQKINLKIKNFYVPFEDDKLDGLVSEIAITIFDIVFPFQLSFN